ncbi:MAG: hypothetical protein ACREXY_19350 [Gammaproteobacteria bacterium]
MAEEQEVKTTTLESCTGACIQANCVLECKAYSFKKKQDGYEQCFCGHTKWGHGVVRKGVHESDAVV